MDFAVQFTMEQRVAHFENQILQPNIMKVQNGTGNMGWSGDAPTVAKAVNRERGESETGCWLSSMRLAACAVALPTFFAPLPALASGGFLK